MENAVTRSVAMVDGVPDWQRPSAEVLAPVVDLDRARDRSSQETVGAAALVGSRTPVNRTAEELRNGSSKEYLSVVNSL